MAINEPHVRGLRYVEWTWDPDPDDETCVAVWMEIFAGAGFEDVRAVPIDHSELKPGTYQGFTGRRPA